MTADSFCLKLTEACRGVQLTIEPYLRLEGERTGNKRVVGIAFVKITAILSSVILL